MKKTVFTMTEEERQKAAMMIGDMVLMLQEGYGESHISEKYKLHPYQVRENILEVLFVLRNHVGKWTYFKELFTK